VLPRFGPVRYVTKTLRPVICTVRNCIFLLVKLRAPPPERESEKKSHRMLLRRACRRPLVQTLATLRRRASTVASQEPAAGIEPSAVDDLSKPVHTQLPKRKPFVKSMFLGTVDSELLSFPESLNRDEQSRLTQHRQRLEQALREPDAPAPRALHALQGPLEHGGKRFTETELAHVTELLADNRSAAMVTLEHNAIVKLLAHHATDEAKGRYLDRLCSGELTVASALYELTSARQTMFGTVAALDHTSGRWTLTGTKVFLRNGDTDPDLLLVLASTKHMERLNRADATVAALLVDTKADGVRVTQAPLGTTTGGLSRVTVHFNRVEVPATQLLGADTDGGQVLSKFLSATRVQSSVVRVGLLKKVLNVLTDFCINTKTSNGEMMDIELVREQLARMASVIYAAESMVYMTASLMDDFDGQDVELEAAITKVFSTGSLLGSATLPLRLLGPQALAADGTFETLFNDALKLFIGDESLDSVNLFVALSGLQYAGMHSYETIKKDRNPAMNPSYVLSKLFEKTSIANPKKFADLQQYFHPSLDPAAHWLEFSVVRLQLAVECVLSRHGVEVIERHVELGRVAQIATLLYAMTACASRASRAYCIGLRHAAQDVHLANMFCRESSETVRLLALELEKGPYMTSDDDYNVVARNLFREKGYFFEHPLARNF
uniref:Acyl-CoA dehydrogenase/oxidase C-terminal domain-containing protein n=1 Tax=Anopheles dirus TaxID=7168 RepID=A0A182N185_9DIPT